MYRALLLRLIAWNSCSPMPQSILGRNNAFLPDKVGNKRKRKKEEIVCKLFRRRARMFCSLMPKAFWEESCCSGPRQTRKKGKYRLSQLFFQIEIRVKGFQCVYLFELLPLDILCSLVRNNAILTLWKKKNTRFISFIVCIRKSFPL